MNMEFWLPHHGILRRETRRLQQDPAILGIMLIGSLAGEYATEYSDLDLYVLGGEDSFSVDWNDGVMVETTSATPESARKNLQESPMEVYRWQDAKILYDPQGLLASLTEEARRAYEAYEPSERLRRRIAHWLVSLELKLKAALSCGDMRKAGFLAATNAWMLLEAMWAANAQPMPPTSTAYRSHGALERYPCAEWFQALFEGTVEQRAAHELRLIAWLVPILKEGVGEGTF